MTLSAVLVIAAYLLGSLSTAVITCRLMGLPDPRGTGSGNPGATNVLRQGNRRAAAITLAGDVLKGLLPVVLARVLQVGDQTVAAVAVAAFLGHLYPVFFGFKGGKGVATAGGALIGLSPWGALGGLATWVVVARLTRISSVAALAAAVLAPMYLALLGSPKGYVVAAGLMAALLVWRHRTNIQRLLGGTEGRF